MRVVVEIWRGCDGLGLAGIGLGDIYDGRQVIRGIGTVTTKRRNITFRKTKIWIGSEDNSRRNHTYTVKHETRKKNQKRE